MALSPQQIQAAELISRGYSHQEVADAIRVSRRTILRWLKQQDFRDLSFGLTNRTLQSTPHRGSERPIQPDELKVEDLVPDALAAVRDILQNPDSRNVDKLKAAALVGDWSKRLRPETSEMEALKVLIDAEWIDDDALNVFLKNWRSLKAEVENACQQSVSRAN